MLPWSMATRQHNPLAEWFRDLFERDLTRLILSGLIILSLLPWFHAFTLGFFAVFAAELWGRFVVMRDDLRQRSLNRVEVIFFIIDVAATLSFLPFHLIWGEVRFLRLLRLSRMLLLLGYWGPMVREIWTILMKRERRYQIVFVAASVMILSFLSAILLFVFSWDGNAPTEHFWSFLWWSFRQIQDPGNMVQSAKATLMFFCSVFLTLSGLFLFSFLIGIATSVVEELVRVGREKRIGLKRHSVICNIGPFSRVLLEELVTYYEKSLRSPKIITMGPAAHRYSYMYDRPLQRVRYRQGQPLSSHDLLKVDADRATRVLLMSGQDRETSDSEVVSQILSVREVNRDCFIFAELLSPDNIQAAHEAGGTLTVPILTEQLISLYLARITVQPGLEAIYTDLFTSRGEEIYTCLYDLGAMTGRTAPSGRLLPFGDLLIRGHRAHGAILLGHMLADSTGRTEFRHALNPGSPRSRGDTPPSVPPVQELRGFFGLATSFEGLRELVESLPDVAESARKPSRPSGPLPRFEVCPVAADISAILICGFHEGLVDYCEQLILMSEELTIYLMVFDDQRIVEVTRMFVDRPVEEAFHHVDFSAVNAHQVRYTVREHPDRSGRIHVFAGDWSNERTIVEQPSVAYRLEQMDAVLFTYSAACADPDARTALGLLKLIRLRQSRPEGTKRGLRIVCQVKNTDKATLLSRRFGDSDGICHPITVVAAESMRNALMAQAVFVPGIAAIYRDLLGGTGQQICKLLVTSSDAVGGALTFGQLLCDLYHQRGMVILAVELEGADRKRRLVINPHPKSEDYHFQGEQLRSIFALADPALLGRADQPCEGCFAATV